LTILDGIMGCRRNGLSEQWAMGIMSRRSNGLSEEWLSEKWAVGIMGCRNYDLTRNNHLTKWPKMPMHNPNLYILLYIFGNTVYKDLGYFMPWMLPATVVCGQNVNQRTCFVHKYYITSCKDKLYSSSLWNLTLFQILPCTQSTASTPPPPPPTPLGFGFHCLWYTGNITSANTFMDSLQLK